MDEKKEEVKIEPKVDKALELTRKTEHLDNLKREVVSANDQTKEILERKALFLKKINASRKSSELILDNFKILKPNWAYEENEDYILCLKEINECIFAENELNWVSQESQVNKNLEAVDAQRKSLLTEIERLEKEMKENE